MQQRNDFLFHVDGPILDENFDFSFQIDSHIIGPGSFFNFKIILDSPEDRKNRMKFSCMLPMALFSANILHNLNILSK